MQLDIAGNDFVEMWQWTVDTAAHPTAYMNSQAYNVNDGLAYGIFSPTADNTGDSYLCRFSHVQNSAICLCKSEVTQTNGATITPDGTYYLAKQGGLQIWTLANTQGIAYPAGSPADVSTLGDCGMTKVQQGRGTGGPVDVSGSGLTTSSMDANYDITDGSTGSYMTVWTASGSSMATWTPGNQKFSDYIDFEHGGVTYLIGLGASDASVQMIKLATDGAIAGYAYSHVVMDYTGSSTTVRTMSGWGAG
jgi:hypothetical protein